MQSGSGRFHLKTQLFNVKSLGNAAVESGPLFVPAEKQLLLAIIMAFGQHLTRRTGAALF